jgi:hypothetical protein
VIDTFGSINFDLNLLKRRILMQAIEKKQYVAPKLAELGNVATVTLQKVGGGSAPSTFHILTPK